MFPGETYSPYKMLPDEAKEFARQIAAERVVSPVTKRRSSLPPLPPAPQIIEPVADNSSSSSSSSPTLTGGANNGVANQNGQSTLNGNAIDPHGDTIKVY